MLASFVVYLAVLSAIGLSAHFSPALPSWNRQTSLTKFSLQTVLVIGAALRGVHRAKIRAAIGADGPGGRPRLRPVAALVLRSRRSGQRIVWDGDHGAGGAGSMITHRL